jgi:hypothetical protein
MNKEEEVICEHPDMNAKLSYKSTGCVGICAVKTSICAKRKNLINRR